MIQIQFDQGSLLLKGSAKAMAPISSYVAWDKRIRAFRSEGRHYGPIVLTLFRQKIPFKDQAKAFEKHTFQTKDEFSPRPHQAKAIERWRQADGRGIVVLPTGAGKTLVARLAIAQVKRNTLILVPTLDLLNQWHEQLSEKFPKTTIGMIGGGVRTIETITVSTYDSAFINMEHIGNQFGFLICDECHHLPALSTRQAAIMSIAPFRLGLTATPEREDGLEDVMMDLLGPVVHRTEITELEGEFLAPYNLEHIAVDLDDDERKAYDNAYQQYRSFADSCGVDFRSRSGWSQFIQVCARSRQGRAAYAAYLTQKRIARASRAKLRTVWKLLSQHRGEQAILFTDDNATAYTIGETFFLPVLTYKTKSKERKAMLAAFRERKLSAMVTSRVLNEGVDVPEVSVGIVVSGTGSVREHVQRLGRILRPREGKQAVLYELVSNETSEAYTSERRRQHLAYQQKAPPS
ncbi:DEAD/DEAH box helicase [Magnetococcales bacterium HHB-1]